MWKSQDVLNLCNFKKKTFLINKLFWRKNALSQTDNLYAFKKYTFN